LEGGPPDSNLPIGAGVVVTAIQLTGQWSALRYIPQPGEFPGWSAASGPGESIAQNLRGLPLAAAITSWWLLRRYRRSAATRLGKSNNTSTLSARPTAAAPEGRVVTRARAWRLGAFLAGRATLEWLLVFVGRA
jgi:hypothetical protein